MRSLLHEGDLEKIQGTGITLFLFMLFITSSLGATGILPKQKSISGYYDGRLGHYPIELYIEKEGDQLSGYYVQRYKHEQRNIDLEGEIDQQGSFKLKGQGIFSGRINNGEISGYWYRSEDSRERYSFSLSEKKPEYYSEGFWRKIELHNGVNLKIPVNSEVAEIDKDQFMNNRMVLNQDFDRKTSQMEQVLSISFPIQKDSSIVSKFYLEIASYEGLDSLSDFLPDDTLVHCNTGEMVLGKNNLQWLSYEEGDTGGSYNSRIYFYRDSGANKSIMFHLFYSYANPWMYGNPYSQEEYEGPYINNLNSLVEIAEMIIGSI